MQDADNAESKGTRESLSNNNLVGLSGSVEENIQKGTVFEEIMAENIRNCKNNVAMGNVKHAFGKSVSALHVVKISAGRTEAGFTGEGNPTNLVAAVTAVHGAVLWIPAVEDFFDF